MKKKGLLFSCIFCFFAICFLFQKVNCKENAEALEPDVVYVTLDTSFIHFENESNLKSLPVYDRSDNSAREFFSKSNVKYIIRHTHKFDSISIPENSELFFDGGSLSGSIYFNNTYLSGNVRLRGSKLFGAISNRCFYSNWLCYGDSKHDDAQNINSMLSVCDNIIFQAGTYNLKSFHRPNPMLNKKFVNSVVAHIGIFQSNKHLIGEDSVAFLIEDEKQTCCIYSIPGNIDKSISNIGISNIQFVVKNKKDEFHEFFHTIKTIGVNGLSIKDCTFYDFLGDAICLSHYGDNPSTGERTRNSNVIISGNTIWGSSHNNRNGISVINGEEVRICNNCIYETSSANMPGAIDIEANNSAYTINRITIEENEIVGSKGSGAAIGVICNKKNAPAYNIIIKNNRISRSNRGLLFIISNEDCTENFEISGNFVDEYTSPYYFGGKGYSKNWKCFDNHFKKKISSKIGGNINIQNLKTQR